jgi:uncharacterized membrane protein
VDFARGEARRVEKKMVRPLQPGGPRLDDPPVLAIGGKMQRLRAFDEKLDPRQNDRHLGWNGDGRSLREVAERRAKGLGVFSLGLGLAQVLAPRSVARLVGLPETERSRTMLTLIGMRELASGIGLLARPGSASWAWTRVVGDAMDLALLGDAFSRKDAEPARLAAATAAVLGVAALDTASAAHLSRNESVQKLVLPIHVVKTITIGRPPAEVYAFWRDFENLPRFMAHLESVTVENGTSTWRAKAPAGTTVEWQAEVVMDRPDEAIGWRSVEGTRVPNRGVVRFEPAPGDRGTQLRVELKYEPPGGALGVAIAKLFGEEPAQQIASDLRRLKQVLETGEVLHSDASVHRGLHPARPSETNVRLNELGKADI